MNDGVDDKHRRARTAHALLQPIVGYLNLLLQDPTAFGVTDETRQILERCVKSVDRERQIIDQMVEFFGDGFQ